MTGKGGGRAVRTGTRRRRWKTVKTKLLRSRNRKTKSRRQRNRYCAILRNNMSNRNKASCPIELYMGNKEEFKVAQCNFRRQGSDAVLIFEGDNNTFLSDNALETLYTRLGKELENLSQWFKANKLSLNLSKTSYITSDSKNRLLPELDSCIKIYNKEISQIITTIFYEYKYVEEHLTFNDHCLNHHQTEAQNKCISDSKCTTETYPDEFVK